MVLQKYANGNEAKKVLDKRPYPWLKYHFGELFLKSPNSKE